jgi:hypothetical protein
MRSTVPCSPGFQDDGVDAGAAEQMAKHEAGRTGADDADLRACARHQWGIMAQSSRPADFVPRTARQRFRLRAKRYGEIANR